MTSVALGVGFFVVHGSAWGVCAGNTTISTALTAGQPTNNSMLCSYTVDSLGSITTNNWFESGISNIGTIDTLTNSGLILTNSVAANSITNIGTIGSLINSVGGTLSTSATGNGTPVRNYGAINFLTNSGTISAVNAEAIYNSSVIGTLTNYGNIVTAAVNSRAINNNNATITTFNNLQGASASALTYTGKLPINYNIIISNSTNYGKLSITSPSGQMIFGISSLSTTSSAIVGQTLTGVLQGFGSNLSTYISSGLTSSNGYTYSLTQQGSTGTWDLLITACSICTSGGSSSSGGGATISNVTVGTSVGLSALGVTANPVLAGGTLVLSRGDSSSVSIAITSAGGTIQAPTSGSAILSGVFSGSGGLTFTSSAGTVAGGTGGSVVLSGANTYSGGTTVSGGTLVVAGASPTGTGDVFVASAGTLMGTGTIAGNGIVSGVLKPGNSPGYLSFTQNLTLNSGSTYQQDIAGNTQATSA